MHATLAALRSPTRSAREHLVERAAADALHGEVLDAVGAHAEVVDRHDRRVLELALDLGLEEEARAELRLPRALGRITLIATARPMRVSLQRRTSPMPPRPSISPLV